MLGCPLGIIFGVISGRGSPEIYQALVVGMISPVIALTFAGFITWGFTITFLRARAYEGWTSPRDAVEATTRGLEYSLGMRYGVLRPSDSLAKLAWLSFPSYPFLHEIIRNTAVAAGAEDPATAVEPVEAAILNTKPRTVEELASFISPLLPHDLASP